MIKVTTTEDGPTRDAVSALADEERVKLDAYLFASGLQPCSNFEWAMVKTYLMAKQSGELDGNSMNEPRGSASPSPA
jgi:hypothetical protein